MHWPNSEGCQPVDLNLGRSCTEFIKGGILVEVEHVKVHRSKQEKQQMSHFEIIVTEG